MLTDVANELRDRGALDEAECFIASRPAKVGDKLTTHDFGTGTRGFAASEDMNVAVCVLPRVLAFNLNLSPLDEAEKNPRILRLCRRGKAPIKSSQQLRVRRTYGDSTAAGFRDAQFDRDQVLLVARSTTFIFLI